MISHVVLFRPRRDLHDADRHDLADALARAMREIPSVRGARVGRRVTHGRAYEALMRVDYEYAVLLEFDDLEGLKAYLNHPAHETLATRFFAAFDEALMYDFEMRDAKESLAGLF